MARTEKDTVIDELRERLGTARSAVLTDFRGLSVAEITELRALCRKSAVEYKVVKNTLAKIAIKDTRLQGLTAYLEGPTAVAFSREDPMAPSRVLTAWGKSRPTFAIKGGVVEGRVVSPEEITALATLPPREVLLAQAAGAFNAPIQAVVNVLAGPIRMLAGVLGEICRRKEKTV